VAQMLFDIIYELFSTTLSRFFFPKGKKVGSWNHHALCVCVFVLIQLRTKRPTFTKFGSSIMPLEAIPTSYFLISYIK